MNHTPGPWRIHDTKIIAVDGSIIIDCMGAMGGSGNTRRDKQLLAAAPDLLDALTGIVFTLEHREGLKYRKDLVTDDELGRLKAAIAKAEGREP